MIVLLKLKDWLLNLLTGNAWQMYEGARQTASVKDR